MFFFSQPCLACHLEYQNGIHTKLFKFGGELFSWTFLRDIFRVLFLNVWASISKARCREKVSINNETKWQLAGRRKKGEREKWNKNNGLFASKSPRVSREERKEEKRKKGNVYKAYGQLGNGNVSICDNFKLCNHKASWSSFSESLLFAKVVLSRI